MLLDSLVNSGIELSQSFPVYTRKELDDSIVYAKRIQDGMMLKEKHLRRIFAESFIYMRPRNIVSGDFYWFTRIYNKIVIAVADCTGHGIPGALMSILGISLLNQIVIEEKNTDPAFILHRLDHKVNKAFGYTQDIVDEAFKDTRTDGMDICLCCIDSIAGTMTFSGAYRPIYHIRNGELKELKGNRRPIGGQGCDKRFTNQYLELAEGDNLYMLSDGYASQFGYLVNKKFSSARVKDLLQYISGMPCEMQKHELEKSFMSWKLQEEQTDDVLALGFRI